MAATSTEVSPWYIVPANGNDDARLIVSEIVIDALAGLNMQYQVVCTVRRRELLTTRRQLAKSGGSGVRRRRLLGSEGPGVHAGELCAHQKDLR
jgi:hypothetical protein